MYKLWVKIIREDAAEWMVLYENKFLDTISDIAKNLSQNLIWIIYDDKTGLPVWVD